MRASVLLVLLVVKVVAGYTTRSYDLEVPGSNPIRIIEADPIWDRPPQHSDFRTDRVFIEHRTIHPLEGSTDKPDTLSERGDHDYEDNSHKLKDFLDSYAEKVKRRLPYRPEMEDELYLKDVDVPEHEEQEESEEDMDVSRPEKSKAWNMVQAEKHHRPYDDDKGWVSMDAVPWSMSKISKWQSRPNPDKLANPFMDRPNAHEYGRPQNFGPKPSHNKPYRPKPTPPSYYNDEDEDEEEEDYPQYPNKKRPYHRPTAVYGQKVHLQTVGPTSSRPWDSPTKPWDSSPKPWDSSPKPWDSSPKPWDSSPKPWESSQKPWDSSSKPWDRDRDRRPQNQDCKNPHHQPAIITDGLPPDFPDHGHDYGNRRRGSASENLPNTHPFKGDVLPPLKDGKVNMTTSHGGLLQVESTFQTVEQAQKAFVKRQKLKIKRKPIAVKLRPSNPTIPTGYQQLPYQVDSNRDNTDTASVLAAVGAGMIPASMALLVPMAMNGRKRRDLKKPALPTTNPYADEIEITLPRSF